MADPAASASASAKSAWAAAQTKFSETPAKGPCIPCAAKKKKNPVGAKWKKDAAGVFPGHQKYQDCGLEASRQIIEQAKGKLNVSEHQFMDDAITMCNVDSDGGANGLDRQCVMQQYGVSSKLQDANVANVDAALRDGKGVIVNADSKTLWHMQGIETDTGDPHAVLLSEGIYDDTGKMTGVWVNDTGIGQRYPLSTDELAKGLKSGSGLMNVTDKPIWPSD